VERLKEDAGLQLFDLPLGGGVTIVRKLDPAPASVGKNNEPVIG
jgi:hypothetical protein